MTSPIFPDIDSFIYVKFELNGKLIWWPSTVKEISSMGSLRRKTLKVFGKLCYQEFKQDSAEYKEEMGTVHFLTDKLLHIIDGDGHFLSEASWRYNFDVPNCNDPRALRQLQVQSPHGSNMESTKHRPNNIMFARAQTTETLGRESDPITNPLHSSDITMMKEPFTHFKRIEQRLCYLEQESDMRLQQSIKQVWSENILSLQYTIRRKILDTMQRPLNTNRQRVKSLHSNVFQPQTHRFTFDCNYSLFAHILQDIIQQYANTKTVLFKPVTLLGHIPASSTGPLHIIFRRFKDLASWFHVRDSNDLTRLLFRYSKSSATTAVGILGSTIYNEQNNNEGIDVFVGKSSSTHTELEKDFSHLDSEEDFSFCLKTKRWDSANNKFVDNFKKIPKLPNISASSDFLVDSNNYFQLIWEVIPTSTRAVWSADSMFTQSTILGTLSVILPSAEFYGRDLVNQVSAEDFYNSHQ